MLLLCTLVSRLTRLERSVAAVRPRSWRLLPRQMSRPSGSQSLPWETYLYTTGGNTRKGRRSSDPLCTHPMHLLYRGAESIRPSPVQTILQPRRFEKTLPQEAPTPPSRKDADRLSTSQMQPHTPRQGAFTKPCRNDSWHHHVDLLHTK